MPIAPRRGTWIAVIVLVAMPGAALSQIDSTGSCTSEGLVMAGTFEEGKLMTAGPSGGIGEFTMPVHDWPFRLECVRGKLRLTSGLANGATEVTHAVSWMRQAHRSFLVAFRGDNLDPEGTLDMFEVQPGALPTDTPVVTYTSTTGHFVELMKGVLAIAAPPYKTYIPPWK